MLATLLTDFGTADYFVAAMKGVILAGAPRATLVDITHHVPAHDVQAGAFTLLAAWRSFAEGTVHVGVVDPGVGSARRPLLARAGGHLFVGPDNGLFSYVFDHAPPDLVLHLDDPRLFRHPVSTTFHGRDVFAPVAGALLAGGAPEEMGTAIGDPVRLEPIRARRDADGVVRGRIVHVDRFGNCVTSIAPADLPPERREGTARIRVGGRMVRSIRRFFTQPDAALDEPFGIWGSAGLLEIAVERDSAALRLGIGRGEAVEVLPDDSAGA